LCPSAKLLVAVVLGSVAQQFLRFRMLRILLNEDFEGDLARVLLVLFFSLEGVLEGAIAPQLKQFLSAAAYCSRSDSLSRFRLSAALKSEKLSSLARDAQTACQKCTE
jgi:hypothetical protein